MKQLNVLCLILVMFLLNSCLTTEDKPVVVDIDGSQLINSTTGIPLYMEAPDGWASFTADADNPYPETPGGSAATTSFTVTNRAQFESALKNGGLELSNEPKVIYVYGLIDLCADEKGKPVDPYHFIKLAGYGKEYKNYEDYVTKFAASCVGKVETAGLADHQQAIAAEQYKTVKMFIPSNTTIIGLDANSGFKNGGLAVDSAKNVIIRNLTIMDSYDYFPVWEGTDKRTGLFNSEYDNMVIENSSYVWIDHCFFSDGDRPDAFGRKVEIAKGWERKWVTHDGLLDIKNGSNYVTISWNVIKDHDKCMLWGTSDANGAIDAGKLKITLHHNWIQGSEQRNPRVRFGSVHIYNNVYKEIDSYSIGVGDHSRIYSENNIFADVSTSISTQDDDENPGYIYDTGSLNVNPDKLDTLELVGWNPAEMYSYTTDSVDALEAIVAKSAGPDKY